MFDGFIKWIGGLFGGKKEEEKKKPVQPASLPSAPKQPLLQQARSPHAGILNPQKPSQSLLTAPASSLNASTTNKNIIAATQPKLKTATDAPKMLTREGAQDWANHQNNEIRLNDAMRSNNTREALREVTLKNSLKKGAKYDNAKRVADATVSAADASRQAAKDKRVLDAVARVTEIPRNIGAGIGKSIVKTPSDVAQGIGAIGAWASSGDTNSWLSKTSNSLSNWGIKTGSGIDKWFDENTRASTDGIVGDVAQGVGQLSGDVATSLIPGAAVTKLPKYAKYAGTVSKAGTLLPTARYGLAETGQQYHQAKEAGKSDAEAGAIGAGAGFTQAALEKVGLDKFMKAGGGRLTTTMLKRGAIEGAQEGTQQFGSNAWEASYNPDKDLMDDVGYSALVGGLSGGIAGGAMHNVGKPTYRDPSAPVVTSVAPSNDAEKSVAIQHGIVTPATKAMSVDEKVQTALNSDIGEQVRYRQSSEADIASIKREALQHPNIESFLAKNDTTPMTDKPTYVNGRNTDIAPGSVIKTKLSDGQYRVVDASPDGLMIENIALDDLPPGYERPSPMRINPSEIESVIEHVQGDVRSPRDMATDLGLTQEQLANIYTQVHSGTDWRLGQPGSPITRADMQNIQLENNRIFGSDAPNVEFKDGIMLTPEGRTALGSTTDTASGASTIQIARQQGDSQATYLHEAVHKALNDYMTSEERASVVISYANDKRVSQEAFESQEQYEHEVEELMAEDFIQYVAARRDENIPKPSIVQRVKEVFEKVFRRLQYMVAKQRKEGTITPEYMNFYYDLATGRYADKPRIDKVLRDASAEQLQLAEHRDMLQRQFDNTEDLQARRTISQQIAEVNGLLRTSKDAAYRDEVSSDKRFREEVPQQRTMRDALNDVIFQNNPDLLDDATRLSYYEDEPQLGESYGDNIPRIHVDDLKHYLGKQAENIPTRYRRRTGERNVDLLAQRAGYDDVGEYLTAIQDTLDNRRVKRERQKELSRRMAELRKDPDIRQKAQQLLESEKPPRQTQQEYIAERMPETIRSFYDEVMTETEAAHPESYSRLMHWLKKNSDKLINEYQNTKDGIAAVRHDARVKKFEEFTKDKHDAEVLADLAPEAVKVEHINSKVRVLHMPGGDTAVKVDVTAPRSSKVQEFAVRSTIDEVSGKQTIDLVPLDGEKHTLKNGMVVDKDGKSIGSYASIDENGTQIAYIEGKPVNITGILGDIEQWGNLNRSSWDMDRLIEENAPDKETARKVQKFLTQFKDQQEAMMKTEIVNLRKQLREYESAAIKNRPKDISKKDVRADFFRVTEKKANYEEIIEKYGQSYVDDYMKPAVTWWRGTADKLLDSTNSALERNGYDPIPRLDNYITHIQSDPSFWEKVGIGIKDINPLGSSISSDINPGKTRGGIPEEIVGNTENTGVRRKWNPFAQVRRGSQHEQDFFAAIDSYFEPMLFNKYMTPAASRARVIERSFRMFEEAKKIREQQELDDMAEIFGISEAKKMMGSQSTTRNHSKYKADRRSPMITAWQEYGNILAGKTNALDRVIIDKLGEGGEKALAASTKIQGVVGASTIPGSASAAVAQVLSVPQTIARDGVKAFAQGVYDMISNDGKRAGSNDPLRKSSFMRARYTDASSKRKSFIRQYTSVASVPMELIERATGEISWRSAYNKALSEGLNRKEAVSRADVETKKTLAGRGIGDRPMLMNSKAINTFTQFGLEVNNMRVQFFHDFTPKQKIKFMVAALAMNAALRAVTGNDQLPDYIKAIFDTLSDFENEEDDKKDTALTNALQALQRVTGETLKFVPGAPSIASAFMDDKTKETVFGKNSDISRYGTPPVGRIANIVKSAVKGDWAKATSDTAALLPTGNQVRKTIGGASVLDEGYTENYKGNVHNVYDNTDVFNATKATLFGKNAIPGEQEASDSGRALDKKQSEVFRRLYEQDPEKAEEYFNTVMGIKVMKSNRKGSLTDVGYKPDSAGASSVASMVALEEAKAKLQTDIGSGEVVERDGVYYTKGGAIKSAYYREVAKSGKEGNTDAYKSYLYGYGLSTGTKYEPKVSSSSTGDSLVDKLKAADKKTGASNSLASNAVALFKGGEKYRDIPQWVKDRFYKEADYSKKDVEYGALASFKASTKLEAYYRPLAQNRNHATLMAELVRGRAKSIYNNGYMAANDSVISTLYKEGYLSKDEQRYLKSINGSISSTKSKSASRATAHKSSVSQSDISRYVDSTRNRAGLDVAAIVKKYGGTSFSAPKSKARAVRMRTLKSSKAQTGGKGQMKRML